jgi:hypothetical protein
VIDAHGFDNIDTHSKSRSQTTLLLSKITARVFRRKTLLTAYLTPVWPFLKRIARDLDGLEWGDSRIGWKRKNGCYEKIGFKLGEGPIVTVDDLEGGLDSSKLRQVAETIKKLK